MTKAEREQIGWCIDELSKDNMGDYDKVMTVMHRLAGRPFTPLPTGGGSVSIWDVAETKDDRDFSHD